MSCWLRFVSSLISTKNSLIWHLILISKALLFCFVLLKILLLCSSQICQQIVFGRMAHAVLITWFLGGRVGYLAAQLENKSTMEQGIKNLGFTFWMKESQICFENLHSRIKWETTSEFSLHNEHIDGPWNHFLWRISYVSILSWQSFQEKKSILGHERMRQTPCHGAGSGGTWGLSFSLLYPMETR